MSNKKGLSTIIVTLILILLSLVAVGIVWVVVSNILQSGTEQTSSGLGQIFLSIGIENVKVESNGDVSVSVKRNAGEGDLSGINFIVSDGENSQVIKKSESLGELATKKFTITSAELTGVAFVKEISIAPISGTEGNEKVGSVVDSFEIKPREKLLSALDSTTGWTAPAFSPSGLDTLNKKEGSASFSGTESDIVTDAPQFRSTNDFGDLSQFSNDNDFLEFWFYIDDISKITCNNAGIDCQVELGNTIDSQEYYWQVRTIGLVNGWNHVALKMGSATKGVTGGPINWASGVDHFRIYLRDAGLQPYTAKIDEIKMVSYRI